VRYSFSCCTDVSWEVIREESEGKEERVSIPVQFVVSFASGAMSRND
jgi:hypothetical protein